MTSSAVPTGADDDRGTTYDTKATRGGAALEKGEGGDVELSVAEEVGHARSKVSGHSASGAESADMEDADGSGMCGSAETQRGPASCHDAASYPGDESLRRSYPGDEDVGILKKSQGGNVKISVAEEVGHARSKVSGHSASGAEKCDMQERRLSLSANAETAAHGGAPPTTRKEDEHDPPASNSRTCTEQSSFERRVRRRAERFGTEETERGNGGEASAAVRRDVERSGPLEADGQRELDAVPEWSWRLHGAA